MFSKAVDEVAKDTAATLVHTKYKLYALTCSQIEVMLV